MGSIGCLLIGKVMEFRTIYVFIPLWSFGYFSKSGHHAYFNQILMTDPMHMLHAYKSTNALKAITLLTLWTPEDGIPTICKLSYAAGLLYTVQTARYHMRRQTVYLRYGA